MSTATLGFRVDSLEARVTALEERASAGEETMYEMRRDIAMINIRTAKMAQAMGLSDVTKEEIDAALDER